MRNKTHRAPPRYKIDAQRVFPSFVHRVETPGELIEYFVHTHGYFLAACAVETREDFLVLFGCVRKPTPERTRIAEGGLTMSRREWLMQAFLWVFVAALGSCVGGKFYDLRVVPGSWTAAPAASTSPLPYGPPLPVA